ncbi:MAG: hypothetical protein LBF02_00620 [Mycoplasmataceae bacterium]|jgi:hypothetical protein|nr:hypothetical protein [Mycoplasmataceae bacterium]
MKNDKNNESDFFVSVTIDLSKKGYEMIKKDYQDFLRNFEYAPIGTPIPQFEDYLAFILETSSKHYTFVSENKEID